MRTQISTGVSERTRQQADDLINKKGYSLRDVVTVAIDRMHKQEFGMKRFKVTAIWGPDKFTLGILKNPKWGSQSMVVEADTIEDARASVIWVEDPSVGRCPKQILVEETSEPLGLQAYREIEPLHTAG